MRRTDGRGRDLLWGSNFRNRTAAAAAAAAAAFRRRRDPFPLLYLFILCVVPSPPSLTYPQSWNLWLKVWRRESDIFAALLWEIRTGKGAKSL